MATTKVRRSPKQPGVAVTRLPPCMSCSEGHSVSGSTDVKKHSMQIGSGAHVFSSMISHDFHIHILLLPSDSPVPVLAESSQSETLMSSFPTVPLDEISICDCETPSAVNGYSLWIVN